MGLEMVLFLTVSYQGFHTNTSLLKQAIECKQFQNVSFLIKEFHYVAGFSSVQI